MSQFLASVHESWLPILEPFRQQISEIEQFLNMEESAGRHYWPHYENVFTALSIPFNEVHVVVVGQDPFPTPDHAMGLSFSVNSHVSPLPKSLINIFKELADDLGCAVPKSGDLSNWHRQGVLLLNRVLTVQEANTGSHRGIGWEDITLALVQALAEREEPVVAILWGKDAQLLSNLFASEQVISSAHPSPLSAYRGFFGSRPFSRCNALLQRNGQAPINWCLP
jgi:uracil-DNA glycosylase